MKDTVNVMKAVKAAKHVKQALYTTTGVQKALKAVAGVKQAAMGVNQAAMGVKQAAQDLAKATAEHMMNMYHMKNMLPGPHLHPDHNGLKKYEGRFLFS